MASEMSDEELTKLVGEELVESIGLPKGYSFRTEMYDEYRPSSTIPRKLHIYIKGEKCEVCTYIATLYTKGLEVRVDFNFRSSSATFSLEEPDSISKIVHYIIEHTKQFDLGDDEYRSMSHDEIEQHNQSLAWPYF
jgi:hypothetical protein